MAEERRDWRILCAAVANEKDSLKLLELVEELIAVLDQRESDLRNAQRGTDHSAANHKSHWAGRTSTVQATEKRSRVITFPQR
jgi:hypothetical protein